MNLQRNTFSEMKDKMSTTTTVASVISGGLIAQNIMFFNPDKAVNFD